MDCALAVICMCANSQDDKRRVEERIIAKRIKVHELILQVCETRGSDAIADFKARTCSKWCSGCMARVLLTNLSVIESPVSCVTATGVQEPRRAEC
jgi:hypothetical protein